MSLLLVEGVSVRFGRTVALRDVSFEIHASEVVSVGGRRRSGRSTLLRIAAGVIAPQSGTVTFDGRKQVRTARGAPGGLSLAYEAFSAVAGRTVVEQVAAPLMARESPLAAEALADRMLARVEARDLGELEPGTLTAEERVRVSLARALVTRPRLVLIDEPTSGLAARARDGVLQLLHALAREDGVAVVMTIDDAASAPQTRALRLHGGEIRGDLAPRAADVIPFGQRRSL